MPTKHAFLSASGAYRWLNCTRQPTLATELGNTRGETEYAREGTVAHAVAEYWLSQLELGYPITDDMIRKQFITNEYFNDDMLNYVRGYIDFLMPNISDKNCRWVYEFQVNLNSYIPEGFGTVDFSSYDRVAKVLRIVDLKYGRGIKVDAVSNPQLQLYALGVLENFSGCEIKTVETVIYQPRINNISSDVYTLEELQSFGKLVAEKAPIAFSGVGATTKAGDWCRFCGCKGRCRAYGNLMLEEAREEFKAYDKLSDDELEIFLDSATELSSYISSLKSELTEAIKNGYDSHGYTLKEVTGKKKMSDKAASMLEALGFDPYKKELKSITELKKELGTKLFDTAVDGLLTVSPSTYKLEKVADVFKEVKDDESTIEHS